MSDLLAAFERALEADALEREGWLDLLRDVRLAEAEPLIRALGRAGAAGVVETMAARAVADPSRALLATLAAVQIAGVGEGLLAMSLDHANTRSQFGKPIGRFQAVQQQLAVMAEHVVLARVAAQAACADGLEVPEARAAVANVTAGAAVPVLTGVAHAIHGAIGITADFPLARLTAHAHALRTAYGSEGYWSRRLGVERLASDADTLSFIRSI